MVWMIVTGRVMLIMILFGMFHNVDHKSFLYLANIHTANGAKGKNLSKNGYSLPIDASFYHKKMRMSSKKSIFLSNALFCLTFRAENDVLPL